MKKIAAILILMAMVIFVCSSCFIEWDENIAETKGIRVYERDYIAEYESTLNVMFDNEWTLTSTENTYEEHEKGCMHMDTRPEQYIKWTIDYHDGNGDLRTFVFDNRYPLYDQIETYIINYIPKYYKENFYDIYLKGVSLAGSSNFFCFFATIRSGINRDDNEAKAAIAEKYLKNLDTPEGTVCLSKLTPANVFEMFPCYFSIWVSFSKYVGDKHTFEDDTRTKIEDMIEAMNKFTNNHLTAKINMGYHEGIDLRGKRDWSYVQGKETYYNRQNEDFDRIIFDCYEGIFW